MKEKIHIKIKSFDTLYKYLNCFVYYEMVSCALLNHLHEFFSEKLIHFH